MLWSLSFLLFSVPLTQSQTECLSRSPRYQDKYITPILSSLIDMGYTYQSGYLYWITDMKKHGGSPSSAYGMWNFNLTSSMKPNPDAPMSMLFHPSDAILFTGCTAPLSTYIGFENYAYAKYRHSNNSNSSQSSTTTKQTKTNSQSQSKIPINNNPNGNSSSSVEEYLVFGSMNGAINQHFLNISNRDRFTNNAAPFDSIYSMITTGDQVTFNDIYGLYQEYNISETVNNVWIPNQYFKYTPYNWTEVGYTVHTYPGPIDTFMPVQRIINHFNQTEFNYYTTYKQPCYLISPRVRNKNKDIKKRRSITNRLQIEQQKRSHTANNVQSSNTNKWLGNGIINDSSTVEPRIPFTGLFDRNFTSPQISEEKLYGKQMESFINSTINYFESEYNMEYIETRKLVNYNLGKHNYGWICYNNNMNCQGDLRDEQYWGTHNGSNVVRKSKPWDSVGTYHLQDNTFMILIGINHFLTNYTIFDNVIFYYESNQYLGLFEPIYMVTNFDYDNSANNFVETVSGNFVKRRRQGGDYFTNYTGNILNKIYMIQIARPQHCEGEYDMGIPQMCPNRTIVDERHKFAMYTRNLMNPITLTRPSVEQIIGDTLIRFKIRKVDDEDDDEQDRDRYRYNSKEDIGIGRNLF